MGVLFRKGDALPTLAEIDVVAFDKTGTVTKGKPALTDVVTADGFNRAGVLGMIAAVKARSEHPVAKAILRGSRAEGVEVPAASGFRSVTGYGVAARVEGREVLIGADRFMRSEGIDNSALAEAEYELARKGRTALFASVDGRLAAVVAMADPVKQASRGAIAALRDRRFRVAMITGDKQETADVIARETGIDHVLASVQPDGKVAAVEDLKRGGRKVAFVGDGINDAPPLAHADVGIVIGTGTDIAIESADVILMSSDRRGVVNAVEVSERTMSSIRQNLAWAFGYNVALIPVAGRRALSCLRSVALACGRGGRNGIFIGFCADQRTSASAHFSRHERAPAGWTRGTFRPSATRRVGGSL